MTEESLELTDGRTVLLRPVLPSDELLLRRAFAVAEADAVASRFLTHKPRLTDAEVRYLTHVDQVDHVALVAVELDPLGRETGVGVTRFIRLPDPTSAEPAVAVAASHRRAGLASLLLRRLMERAVELDVHTFEATFLAGNTPVQHLLADLAPESSFERDGDVVHARVTLPPRAPARDHLLRRWLRAVTPRTL